MGRINRNLKARRAKEPPFVPIMCQGCSHWKKRKGICIRRGGPCRRYQDEMAEWKRCEECPLNRIKKCTRTACYSDIRVEIMGRRNDV